MRTPTEYNKNLKNKQITENMLVDCLFSTNKRAKNYRDKIREYKEYFRFNRHAYDKYGNIEKCQKKKEEYYEQKKILLSVLEPTCIHKEVYGYERKRIYDYDERYEDFLYADEFVWENCYFDRNLYREVYFGDILDLNKPLCNYYLFYDVNGTRTFHTPISKSELEKYNLEIVKIDRIITRGEEIGDLISNQFVNKVINLIKTGDYEYISKSK